jgi:FXSXX-COOH protein
MTRQPAGPDDAARAHPKGAAHPPALAEQPAAGELDLLGMDLATLRNTTHPVLSELVAELRERVARERDESLWGHDSSV